MDADSDQDPAIFDVDHRDAKLIYKTYLILLLLFGDTSFFKDKKYKVKSVEQVLRIRILMFFGLLDPDPYVFCPPGSGSVSISKMYRY
jgi:hypothetical protein